MRDIRHGPSHQFAALTEPLSSTVWTTQISIDSSITPASTCPFGPSIDPGRSDRARSHHSRFRHIISLQRDQRNRLTAPVPYTGRFLGRNTIARRWIGQALNVDGVPST